MSDGVGTMATKSTPQYTIVQHSGFGWGHKPAFARAVELKGVTPAEARKVKKVGGILFDNYSDASDFEDKANGVDGSRPFLQVAGTFSDEHIEGLRIYIPQTVVVG